MLMSAADYRDSLRAYKPRVFVNGSQVPSVADEPLLAPGIAAVGVAYDFALRKEHLPIMTARQGTSGKTVNRMLHIDETSQDLLYKLEAVRLVCRTAGCAQRYLTHDGFNGDHRYSRFNPVIGATLKITPNVTAYGGYAEANRAPTPLELGCADPMRPCLLDNALVGDPPLKQVVSHTYEAGLRGSFGSGSKQGQLNWNLGLFRARNADDIINVASPLPGHQYFQNGGDTLRRGIEAVVVSMGPLERIRELHLRRSYLPQPADIVLPEQSICRCQRTNLRSSGKSHSRCAGPSLQGRRRLQDHRCMEAGSGHQCCRQPVSCRRSGKPESKSAGIFGRQPALVIPGYEDIESASCEICSTSVTTPMARSSRLFRFRTSI